MFLAGEGVPASQAGGPAPRGGHTGSPEYLRTATRTGGGRGRPSSKAAVKHTGVFLNARRAGNQKTFLQSELTATRSWEPRPDRQVRAEKSRCPATRCQAAVTEALPTNPRPRRPVGGFLSDRHLKTMITLKEDGAWPPHGEAHSSWGIPEAVGTPSWRAVRSGQGGPGRGRPVLAQGRRGRGQGQPRLPGLACRPTA